MITKIKGGTVVTDGKQFLSDVYYEDGKIIAVTNDKLSFDEEIDATGKFVCPAFVDIHIHGAADSDFLDNTEEAFLTVSKATAEHGAGTIIPTITSAKTDSTLSCLATYERVKNMELPGACMPGVHLEGPYFSPKQSGAQDPNKIRAFDKNEYDTIISSCDSILRWSAAPELAGFEGFAKACRENGILPCIGHSDANGEEVKAAFAEGFTHVTHLYSCTSMVHRIGATRYLGIVECAYLLDDMTVEIIADGVHLPADLLKLIYKLKGPKRIALITDSMRGAGMPDGPSMLGERVGGLEVVIENGCAYLPDRSCFAGSVAFCDRLVRNMVNLADVPLADAVLMATKTPAQIMGLKTKGSLSVGYDADIVIFEDDVRVLRTVVGGKTVYTA